MHAINELLESERSYIASLRKVIEDYVPELGRLDVPQSLRGQVHNLFGNIEPIFNFHCYRFLPELLVSITNFHEFQENLTKNAENRDNHSKAHSETYPKAHPEAHPEAPTIAQLLKNMSQCFLRNRSSFNLYKSYWENKPKSDVLLDNKEARAFLHKRQLQLGDKLDLSSYLLKPVQRLTKYQQILRAIIDILVALHDYLAKNVVNENSITEKNGTTEKTESTLTATKSQSSGIRTQNSLEKINPVFEPEIRCEELDLLNQSEDMIKWFLRQGNDILAAELIKDCPWNYKTEGGRLIRQDNLHQVVGSKLSVRRVFLFEKLLIICKPKLEFSHLTDTNQRFVFKDGLKTNEFGLTRRKSIDKRFEIWQTLTNAKSSSLSRLKGSVKGLSQKGFGHKALGQIIGQKIRQNSLIFEARDEDQKNLWIQDIETLHWKQMNAFRQQRQKTLETMGITKGLGLIDLNRESKESIKDRSVVVRMRNKNNSSNRNQIVDFGKYEPSELNQSEIGSRRYSTGTKLQNLIRPLETSLEDSSLDEKETEMEPNLDFKKRATSLKPNIRPASMMLPTNIPRTILSNFKRNTKDRASNVFSNSFKYIDKSPVDSPKTYSGYDRNCGQKVSIHQPKIYDSRLVSPVLSIESVSPRRVEPALVFPEPVSRRSTTSPGMNSPSSSVLRKTRVLTDKTRPYSIISMNSSSSGNSSAGPVCKYKFYFCFINNKTGFLPQK